MRRFGSLLMSTVLVTGCASVPTNNESLRVILERSGQSQTKLSAYEQGKRHLQFKAPGLAVAAFEEALKEHPDSVAALNGLAVAYDRLGRGDVAQQYLDRALALDADSVVTLNNLAYLNLVQGNTPVALAYADRAKMAADLPMDMMLPDSIVHAVDRTAEIATQLATTETQRPLAQAPVLPRESDIKRVGQNEWELRIRPPNPADAIRINLPARDVAPRVIAPMEQPLAPRVEASPLAGVAVVSPEIPDSVMADLASPPTSVSAAALSLPTYSAPTAGAIADVSSVLPDMPVQALPEPARVASVIASLPMRDLPAVGPIAAVSAARPALPLQPSPEPARLEPMFATPLSYGSPTPGPIAALSPVTPSMPSLPLPEPAKVEAAVVPTYGPPALGAIAQLSQATTAVPQAPIPESVHVEPAVSALPSYGAPLVGPIAALSTGLPVVPSQPLPGPVQVEEAFAALPATPVQQAPVREPLVVASLAVSEPASRALLVPPAADLERTVDAAAPITAPMIASLAPARSGTPRAIQPVSPKSDWRASVPLSTVVRVSNGTGRALMARRFARYLGEHGLNVRRVANANSFDYRRTVIFYNPDQRAQAEALAAVLPFPVRLAEAKQSRGQVELILGFDLLGLDDSLRSA